MNCQLLANPAHSGQNGGHGCFCPQKGIFLKIRLLLLLQGQNPWSSESSTEIFNYSFISFKERSVSRLIPVLLVPSKHDVSNSVCCIFSFLSVVYPLGERHAGLGGWPPQNRFVNTWSWDRGKNKSCPGIICWCPKLPVFTGHFCLKAPKTAQLNILQINSFSRSAFYSLLHLQLIIIYLLAD